MSPEAEKLTKEECLQLAFVKTFPKNVCIAADKSNEFPYFMMIQNKDLIKIHGSSIIGPLMDKPVWVCCQNLVISGVTSRPMAKFIVPISERIFELQYPAEYLKAKRLIDLKLPQREVYPKVPTAILRFLRAKNHNEYVQTKLKSSNTYLETDEDSERIIYFYIKHPKNEQERREEVRQIAAKIDKECRKNIFKRAFLAPISDKSKLHINEYGRAIDCLQSFQHISFMFRSSNQEFGMHVLLKAKQLGLLSTDLQIVCKKSFNLTFVYLKDKYVARSLMKMCKKFSEQKKVNCKQKW